jgi:hypothetical protein
VLLRVDFSKMAAIAMKTAKMLKKNNEKHKNDHNRLLAKQKLMKLDPLFEVNLTFFAPWLAWQRPPF